MDIIFFGAGFWGQQAYKKYKVNNYKNQLRGFMDNKKTGEYCGLPIISIENVDRESAAVVITIESPFAVSEIYAQLRKQGIKNIYWYLNQNYRKSGEDDFLEAECVCADTWGDCVLPQAEMHIADHCNLNCKGCTHFSPIFEKELPDFKTRMKDVAWLKSQFSNVLYFSILGGEPFLNPDIIKYIVEIRKLLPDSYIQIVTNGLLLLHLDEEVFSHIRENKITVSISEYEPTHKKIKEIEEILKKYRVSYIIRPYDSKQKFNIPLSLSDKSKYPPKCISNGCVNVWNGKIARCPTLMYVEKFNEVFHTDLPTEGIMQMRDCPDGAKLLELLQKEVPLCKHCVECPIEWHRCSGTPEIGDFAKTD